MISKAVIRSLVTYASASWGLFHEDNIATPTGNHEKKTVSGIKMTRKKKIKKKEERQMWHASHPKEGTTELPRTKREHRK